MPGSGMECHNCGGIAKETDLEFQGEPIRGWRCAGCGTEYFDPEQAQRLLQMNKDAKLALQYVKGEIDEEELREQIKNEEKASEIIFIVNHLKKGKKKIDDMIEQGGIQ